MIRKYKGQAMNVIQHIHNMHNYDLDDEKIEDATVLDIFESLIEQNGDGCDMVFTIMCNGNCLNLGNDEIIEEDEVYDCDQ